MRKVEEGRPRHPVGIRIAAIASTATAIFPSCARTISARPAGGAVRRVEQGGDLGSGAELKHLMFLGAFGECCIVPEQQAIVVSRDLPFDRACLIGCGVMTGVGAALNIATIGHARYRQW